MHKFDIIDNINKYKWLISIIISVAFDICYTKLNFIRSIRNCTGDIISISSILLGILGVFVGLLISLRDSDFIKLINKYMEEDAFKFLLEYFRNQFVIKIIFIFVTVVIDFAPAINNKLLFIKHVGISIWSVLFLLTLWGTFYIVDLIVNFELKDYSLKNKKEESSD